MLASKDAESASSGVLTLEQACAGMRKSHLGEENSLKAALFEDHDKPRSDALFTMPLAYAAVVLCSKLIALSPIVQLNDGLRQTGCP